MHDSETFESTPGYEPPQVEDVEICAGTAEVAPGANPISQQG